MGRNAHYFVIAYHDITAMVSTLEMLRHEIP